MRQFKFESTTDIRTICAQDAFVASALYTQDVLAKDYPLYSDNYFIEYHGNEDGGRLTVSLYDDIEDEIDIEEVDYKPYAVVLGLVGSQWEEWFSTSEDAIYYAKWEQERHNGIDYLYVVKTDHVDSNDDNYLQGDVIWSMEQ